jgi:hypothetical protein
MKLTYTLTLADFNAAFRLHRRQKRYRRFALYVWPLLTLACLVGFVAFGAARRLDLMGYCLAIGAGALVGSIASPILRIINIRKSYDRLFPSTRTDRSSRVDIDDECIVREIPGMSQLKIPWSGLFGFVQDERITLLYMNKDCFLMVPTQALSPAQRVELDDLVARHLSKGAA